MCSEAKKDPTYRGDCLKNKEPTSEEYQDFFFVSRSKSSSTLKSIEDETINLHILTGGIDCPKGYMRNRRNRCKFVLIKN